MFIYYFINIKCALQKPLMLYYFDCFYYHPRTLKCFGGRGVPRGRLNSRGRLNDLGAGGYLADA